jgi:hypothetical protein
MLTHLFLSQPNEDSGQRNYYRAWYQEEKDRIGHPAGKDMSAFQDIDDKAVQVQEG